MCTCSQGEKLLFPFFFLLAPPATAAHAIVADLPANFSHFELFVYGFTFFCERYMHANDGIW